VTPFLRSKIEQLKTRQARGQAQLKQLQDSGETQISRTDPDARALRKAAQQTVGYNVQTAVASQAQAHRPSRGHQRRPEAEQLAAQACAAKEVLGVNSLIAVADAGYYSEAQLAECEQANVTAYVAIPDKHQALRACARGTSTPPTQG